MTGTEKQIAWAEDIKSRIISALSDPVNKTTAESKMITDKLSTALHAEDSAGKVIEMFKGVRASGSADEISKSVIAAIRVNPVAQKWAMEVLNHA